MMFLSTRNPAPRCILSSTESIRSAVCLAPDLRQALRLKSAHSQRSMSDIVNGALRQALREGHEDLAAVRGRANEKALGCEDFPAKLKADDTP